ncbi:MAG: gliding motility-associated C-terminal domain-containing protein [Crocinitomicaceae bacterium]|nr:gliding motility-associated C-terminal domain-containing protein [Crocinitomicaceae bacterium]
MKFLLFISCAVIISSQFAMSQDVWMYPNKGQWDDEVEFKVNLNHGDMFIEEDGFTYSLNDGGKEGHHGEEHDHGHEHLKPLKGHVIKTKFLGSSWSGNQFVNDSSTFYTNYIQGNNSEKWFGHIYGYGYVRMYDLYDGIDLELKKSEGLKYSFIVSPDTDVDQIKIDYKGQTKLYIGDEGDLHIVNRFGEILESKPIAWVESEGGKITKVDVKFKLNGDVLSFEFPEGYDVSKTLVIDPTITFSTFTGSSANNWGMTATPDSNGNLFGGGISFGLGYPVTAGAYDGSFNGGTATATLPDGFDVAITKFNSNGDALLYSTYIGGAANELPESMVCNEDGELYILGVTASINFPMVGAYDNSFAGGGALAIENGLAFDGSDIFVVRLSADGAALLGSTFMGGNGHDGLSQGGLDYNYGDQFRGEIILDNNEDVLVASTTQSSNFPVLQGPEASLSGAQDAVAFKLSASLGSLVWSGYFGGVGVETGNSIQPSSSGDVYITGGTTSSDLSISAGEDLSFNGGLSDGYLTRLNGNTGAIMSGTYMGQGEYDQTYCVQLDLDDNVYVLGQTESSWTVSPGVYSNPNSGQFIRKYNSDLSTIEWTTMIGAGSGHVEISPTAFLVSDCYDIYLSGWGGSTNTSGGSANFSTTNGFTVTPDAYQDNTSGNNFYIAVLGEDASYLKYATFMGGTTGPSNHVDGGTSRFDKDGRIYHAVCASCGSNLFDGFPTTPGVYSNTAPAAGYSCNMACFKFELNSIEATIADPNPVVCLPDPVVFDNNSSNGNAFFWDFGDNTTSTDVNPSHLYPGPGDYDVTLIVIDTNNCFVSDTVEFNVVIGDFIGGVVQPPGPVCPGDSFEFEAYGGAFYEWTPANVLNDPTIYNPIATVTQTTDFMVIISDTCGIDTVFVTLEVLPVAATVSNDTSICLGNSATLNAAGGVNYTWTPNTFITGENTDSPTVTPNVTTTYFVEIETSTGCLVYDSVLVEVYFTPPIPILEDSISICAGSSVDIEISGGVTYLWSPNLNINTVNGPLVTVNPPADMYYYCDLTNPCGTVRDSILIKVIEASVSAGNDTIICPGERAVLWATGGIIYSWSPSGTLNAPNLSQVLATPFAPTMYYVNGYDEFGCVSSDSVYVDLYPNAFIQTSPDVYAFYGDEIQLSATSTTSGPFVWSPVEFLSCVVCDDPIANPNQNYFYVVSYTDENGCKASDSVHIYYDPIIYVPNTFTPNADEFNPGFRPEGGNVNTYEMLIFNRWGELIFTSTDFEIGWDGTYEGVNCQDGTYVWKIKLSDFNNKEYEYVGHVNLLR